MVGADGDGGGPPPADGRSTPADDAGDDGAADDDAGLAPPGEPPEWLSLEPGEELRWVGEPSLQSLLPAFFWGLLFLPVFGVGLLVWAGAVVNVRNTDFVVTNTTLYHRSGVLSTNIESVGLDRIQNTEYSQSFSGNLLGYGTIEISTAGSSGSDVSFTAVENAREVRDLISRLGGSGAARPASGGDDEADAAAVGGAGDDLVRELQSELAAVNESMRTVERRLREREGSGPATPDADPASTPASAPEPSDTADAAGGSTTETRTAPVESSRGDEEDGGGSSGSAGEGSDGGSSGAADDEPSGSAVDFVTGDDESSS